MDDRRPSVSELIIGYLSDLGQRYTRFMVEVLLGLAVDLME